MMVCHTITQLAKQKVYSHHVWARLQISNKRQPSALSQPCVSNSMTLIGQTIVKLHTSVFY